MDELTTQSLPLADFLQRMSADRPAPAAGSAAAVTAGMAAALLGKAARLSRRQRDDADSLADSSDALRERALELAEADAAAVTAMFSAGGTGPSDPSAVPREIAELAAQVAQLAARLSEHVNPRLHADAVAAQHLAEAARASINTVMRSNDLLG